MEQFTRECLEIDRATEAGADALLTGGSMEKVYERAARLVKRTLDVEGAVVMDVSHVEVLETTKAEAMISIVSHHGDASTSVHSVSNAEYAKIRDFFVKFPQGKVTEGVVPLCFRSMLPTTRIQHALR
jgi:pimeloyl-CoA synthetase